MIPEDEAAEALRRQLADRARREFAICTIPGPRPSDPAFDPVAAVQALQLGELAGPEFAALQNVLKAIDDLAAKGGSAIETTADPYETCYERGKRYAQRAAASQLRDAIRKGFGTA